ncbi:hypothetical protein [Faecalibacterium hattorii]|uniref:hypothetical protein n=1 Tax=Faecalibacterium hattorii TaxID=2935520 RepID=UPI003AAA7248
MSFTRIDSANIMLAQTPVFMGVPNVGKTSSFERDSWRGAACRFHCRAAHPSPNYTRPVSA